MKILETPRLILRQFQLSDAEALYELNSDEEVMRYTGDEAFLSIAAARQFVKNYDAYTQTGMGRWTVLTKNEEEFLGWCGLKQHPEYVDIGFRFLRRAWGKGYATESAKACLAYAFESLELKEVVGRVARENLASIKVLQKLGMQYWKDSPCGSIEDAVYYRIQNWRID